MDRENFMLYKQSHSTEYDTCLANQHKMILRGSKQLLVFSKTMKGGRRHAFLQGMIPSQPSVPVYGFQCAYLNKNQNGAGDCPDLQTILTWSQLFFFSLHPPSSETAKSPNRNTLKTEGLRLWQWVHTLCQSPPPPQEFPAKPRASVSLMSARLPGPGEVRVLVSFR